MTKFISFIVPALANDTEFQQCLQSISMSAKKLKSEYEIICVVPKKCINDFKIDDQNVRIISETKKGIYSAMNDGILASEGCYLYFIGSDDRILPGFADIVNTLANDLYDVVWFDVLWSGKRRYKNAPRRLSIIRRNTCHQGIIYSRSVFDHYGFYLRKMKVQADHLLNLRIIWEKNRKWKIGYFKTIGSSYAGTGFSSRERDQVFFKLYPLIIKKYTNTFVYFLIIIKRILQSVVK